MASSNSGNPSVNIFTEAPIVDKNGKANYQFTKAMTDYFTRVNTSISSLGELVGSISAQATITGRKEGIGTTVGKINSSGVVQPTGLTAASTSAQGAVILPPGAPNNKLGTASLSNATDFDAAGSAAAAQANAQAFATNAANTAQSNAETFASDASNLETGTVALALLPGISGSFALAKLTVGGANGSLTFQNGVITAVVAPS